MLFCPLLCTKIFSFSTSLRFDFHVNLPSSTLLFASSSSLYSRKSVERQ